MMTTPLPNASRARCPPARHNSIKPKVSQSQSIACSTSAYTSSGTTLAEPVVRLITMLTSRERCSSGTLSRAAHYRQPPGNRWTRDVHSSAVEDGSGAPGHVGGEDVVGVAVELLRAWSQRRR